MKFDAHSRRAPTPTPILIETISAPGPDINWRPGHCSRRTFLHPPSTIPLAESSNLAAAISPPVHVPAPPSPDAAISTEMAAPASKNDSSSFNQSNELPIDGYLCANIDGWRWANKLKSKIKKMATKVEPEEPYVDDAETESLLRLIAENEARRHRYQPQWARKAYRRPQPDNVAAEQQKKGSASPNHNGAADDHASPDEGVHRELVELIFPVGYLDKPPKIHAQSQMRKSVLAASNKTQGAGSCAKIDPVGYPDKPPKIHQQSVVAASDKSEKTQEAGSCTPIDAGKHKVEQISEHHQELLDFLFPVGLVIRPPNTPRW